MQSAWLWRALQHGARRGCAAAPMWAGAPLRGVVSFARAAERRKEMKRYVEKQRRSESAEPETPKLEQTITSSQAGALDFLDDLGGAGAGPAGRSWRASELRIKSFEDLHSLWFVLVKERAVLETERHWCKVNGYFWSGGASKLTKVRVSMARLKTVIGERLRLYSAAKRFNLTQEPYQELAREQERQRELTMTEAERQKLSRFRTLPFADPVLEAVLRYEFSQMGHHRRERILRAQRTAKASALREKERRRRRWLMNQQVPDYEDSDNEMQHSPTR